MLIRKRIRVMTQINAAAAPVAPHPQTYDDIFGWLLNDTYSERFLDRVLAALCTRLRKAGISVARATLHLRTLQREWLGATLYWRIGLDEVEIVLREYGRGETEQYVRSPIHDIHDGVPEVRRRLWQRSPDNKDFLILNELKNEGITDYVVWPMLHTLDRRHAVSFGSDAPQGFTDPEIAFLRRLVPLIALVSEVRIKNVLVRTLLETYVGRSAAKRILNGDTRRGFGSSIEAATMISDLRHFTEMSADRPRDQVIALLDAYFEAIADPIERHGGEILKFMGDGMLAIFPLDQPEACSNLIAAVREGQERLSVLNAKNRTSGLPVLEQGVGVHLGEVSYGNIGSRNRLDFTVIGAVVNIASRLQDMTREAESAVLVSDDFARRAASPDDFHAIGTFPIRGIPEPIAVLTLKM